MEKEFQQNKNKDYILTRPGAVCTTMLALVEPLLPNSAIVGAANCRKYLVGRCQCKLTLLNTK